MNNLLFVYGTLMNDIESMISNHLKTNSFLLGEGKAKGLLYDLGRYPGFVHNPEAETEVLGHIFQLDDPEEMLKTLDEYEGISASYPVDSEYRRELIPVIRQGVSNKRQSTTQFDSDQIKVSPSEEKEPKPERIDYCWCYVYAGDTSRLKLIESGNYLEYVNNNPNHQGFIDSV
jgi:gamma-glutamylcyclotransferase (GGCT)/AIG2-like uncharacterized protein YtfP